MAKEQSVTAGEARMGTVGKQRTLICPKGTVRNKTGTDSDGGFK